MPRPMRALTRHLIIPTALGIFLGGPSGCATGRPRPPGAGDGTALPARRPTVTLFGIESSASRVCYLFDFDGDSIEPFEPLQAELAASIGRLTPEQSFNVIAFFKRPFAESLVPATDEQKRKARPFVHELVGGISGDPVEALELAFRQRPQVIYLVTNGDFPDNEAVRHCLASHRDGGKEVPNVRVNTVAYRTDDAEYRTMLERLAAENGGQFRYVPWEVYKAPGR